jgi:hypothetical protein
LSRLYSKPLPKPGSFAVELTLRLILATMNTQSDITQLQQRIAELESENARLKKEVDFLKLHPTIAQGIKGETLVAQLTDGTITSYAESYDVRTRDGLRLEVKFSKLNQPMKVAPTLRWNWSKPLGWLDKGKDYHYLLLIGEKDPRYLDQYPDGSPYVYFLVPIQSVSVVMNKGRTIGGAIAITTNLAKLQRKANRPALLDFQVSFEGLEPLLVSAATA